MAKLTTTDLTNLANETSAVNTINNNFAAVETAMENTLSRNGSSPNAMGANLDMNSNRVLNLPVPVADSEAVRKDYIDGVLSGSVRRIDLNGVIGDGSIAEDHILQEIIDTAGELTSTNSGTVMIDGKGYTIGCANRINLYEISHVILSNIKLVCLDGFTDDHLIRMGSATDIFNCVGSGLQNVFLDPRFLADGFKISNTYQGIVENVIIEHFDTRGFDVTGSNPELRFYGCDSKRYRFGDSGYNYWANRTGSAFYINSSDVLMSSCTAAYCKYPLELGPLGGFLATHCHFYNGVPAAVKKAIDTVTNDGGFCKITTTTAHGYVNGDVVTIAYVEGIPGLLGSHTISNVTSTTFKIPVAYSGSLAGTTSKTTWKTNDPTAPPIFFITNVTNAGGLCRITTANPHGFSNGNLVIVSATKGTTEAIGTHIISNVTSTTFDIPVTFTNAFIDSPFAICKLESNESYVLSMSATTNQAVFSGVEFDNGGIRTLTNAFSITGSMFLKTGNGHQTAGIRYIATTASDDVDGMHFVGNYANGGFDNLIDFAVDGVSGSYAADLACCVFANMYNSGAEVIGIGQWPVSRGSESQPGLVFSGNPFKRSVDGNTGIYSPTEESIAFTINATEKARLTTTGFGRGITSPQAIAHDNVTDTNSSGPSHPLIVSHRVSNTAQIGIGVGMYYQAETDSATERFTNIGSTRFKTTAIGVAAESADFFVQAINAGTLQDQLKVTNTGAIGVPDSDRSHFMLLNTTSNLTADRTVTLVPGDSDRTLTLSNNVTLDQSVATTSDPQFNTINVGHASDTTISRLSAGRLAVEGAAIPVLPASSTYYTIRRPIDAALTLYVDGATGNDSNLGTVGSPFATIQKALNVAFYEIWSNQYTVTVQVAAGTYAESISLATPSPNNVILKGDDATPANCVISGAIGVSVSNFLTLTIRGFKLTGSTANLYVFNTGNINFLNIDFAGSGNHIQVQGNQAAATATGAYTISASATRHAYCTRGGNFICTGKTVTITGTPAWGTAFVQCDQLSRATLNGNTFSGSATGNRYDSIHNSVIYAAAATLPGSTGGTTATGGLFI